MPHSLSLTRELFVPRELIFQAWTEPTHLSAWYSPQATMRREIASDFRLDGEYLFAWTGEEGVRYVQRGVFRAIDPPGGFRCSLCFAGGFPDHYRTELAVTLEEEDGSSRILIRQEGFPSEAEKDAQGRLWTKLLDQLEAYFSVI